jgi:hypothetical protein
MLSLEGIKVSNVFLSYINKALSRIIHLLPKTGEMIQTKICKSLKFIISRIEINHNALLPFFSYFHLNSNSAILTLTAIKIVESFKYALKENFILKLVLKLCLIINDLRINKALRILAIRWILNLRFSNYNFNFNKHMHIFSSYLCPFPFDNVIVCLEKLKTLYLFYESINYRESEFIIKSISIMDNYKYYPIFSNYVKSLFKTYFFIILRFPYKKFIKNLCEILRNNLKEVPRVLPNMINLLRIIKSLNCENFNLIMSQDLIIEEDLKSCNEKMTFDEIHKYLLIEFSKFIAEFNSPTRLNEYFELFIEIARENSIDPQNLIIGLRNLHSSIQEMRNWKIEKNILEVCKVLLKHHDIEIMKQNKIHDLLYEIQMKSFDYGIRDKAKLYYKLVTNVEKPVLNTFLDTKHTEFNFLNISYEYVELNTFLQNILHLEQSKCERLKEKIEDGGSAIFDQNFKQNVMLLSDNIYMNNNNITDNFQSQTISDFNNTNINKTKYSQFVYNRPIDSSMVSSKDLNDLNSPEELNKIIHNIITPNDILRLYIQDEMIDDTNDVQIDPKIIFQYDREFSFSDSENKIEDVNEFMRYLNKASGSGNSGSSNKSPKKSITNETKHLLNINNVLQNLGNLPLQPQPQPQSQNYSKTEIFLQKFLDDYFLMINKNKFHIKLPLNLFMKKLCNEKSINLENNTQPQQQSQQPVQSQNIPTEISSKLEKISQIYSINLCFGRMSHLDIKGPTLLPYLELDKNSYEKKLLENQTYNINNLKFPYFYKIYLIVYPSQPIPSDVEVRAIFYDNLGVCYTGMLNSIKIKFEDFFLPISVPPQYKLIYDTPEGKIKLREVLFKKLWRQFKMNDTNFKSFVNTSRMVDLDKSNMIKLVFARLGPFLINQNFLKIDYIVNSPYQENFSDLQNEEVLQAPSPNEESSTLSNIPSDNVRIKDYYDNVNNKFRTISYDFVMDEFLEKNSDQSYFAKTNVLRPSRYHLAEVIIFIPEKFHILMKIKISEFSSILEIRSDCLKIIEYLDEYFDTWII